MSYYIVQLCRELHEQEKLQGNDLIAQCLLDAAEKIDDLERMLCYYEETEK